MTRFRMLNFMWKVLGIIEGPYREKWEPYDLKFIRDDIVPKRRDDLEIDYIENGRIETMAIEKMIRSEKWIVLNVCK